jgi:hypothetical protein
VDGEAEDEEDEVPADEVDDEGDNGTVLVYAEPDPAPGPSKSKDVLVTPRRPAKSKLNPKVIDVAKSPGNKFNI